MTFIVSIWQILIMYVFIQKVLHKSLYCVVAIHLHVFFIYTTVLYINSIVVVLQVVIGLLLKVKSVSCALH